MKIKYNNIIFFCIGVVMPLIALSCETKTDKRQATEIHNGSNNSISSTSITIDHTPTLTHWDSLMIDYGLVDIMQLGESGFSLDIKYATDDNFAGKNMYGDFNHAYCTKETAEALVDALHLLQKDDPEWGIVIFDAARPLSVQRIMFDVVRGTKNEKYVARPERGGPHNYGMALDIGLTYKGQQVDMGTPFDTFDITAHITAEHRLVNQGKITAEAMKNRVRLRDAMTASGFRTFSREWWHFTRYTTKYARTNLKLLDF